MKIKTINLLVKIENFLCVYRNYNMFSRKYRILINLRTILELSLTIFGGIFVLKTTDSKSNFATYLLGIVNVIIITSTAVWYAKSFSKLFEYIDANDTTFTPDIEYKNVLTKKYKTLKITLMCCAVAGVIFISLRYIIDSLPLHIPVYGVYFLFYVNSNIKYIYVYVVMYNILDILTEHVNCISRGVEEKSLIYERESENEIQKQNELNTSCFQTWTVAYTNIKESSNLFNHIFGIQMAVVLLTSLLYFIIFLYKMSAIIVAGQSAFNGVIIFYLLKFVLYIFALFMLSRSAHKLKTSAECLRRNLAKLLIYCPISHTSYRCTKDLLKLVATRKLSTRAFGSFTIDMTLLPSSVMFFTSYTVIALQFNNVV